MDSPRISDVPLVNPKSEKGKEIEGYNDKGQDEQVITEGMNLSPRLYQKKR